MRSLRAWLRRLGGVFRKHDRDADLSAELESHVQLHVDEARRKGMSPEQARRDALLKLGGIEQTKENYRDQRGLPWLETVLRDLRFAARRLRKHPGTVAAIVISISLGIAANSTIFSMVSKFVLAPPPVGEPAALLTLRPTDHNVCCGHTSWPVLADLRQHSQSFSSFAAYFDLVPASVGGPDESERVWGQSVTANYFDVTQSGMTLGRGFTSEEEHLPVVVLGYRLWQRGFNADPSIVGKTAMLSGHPFTVLGVAPRFFRGLEMPLDPEFWVPLGKVDDLLPNTANFDSREHHWLTVIARLKPGVTAAQAASELSVLAQLFSQAHPEADKGMGFHLEPAGSLPYRYKSAVLMFLGALMVVVLLVLCIASANVVNLLLAQASGRQREMAVRLSLGATRRNLLRELLTESIVLAFGGGLFGVMLSLWATKALSAFRLPAPVPLDLSLSVDWRVLLYTFVLSFATGVLFGLAPALSASRHSVLSALNGEDLLARPGSRWSLRNVLVVAQIAMSLALLCITGLFLRSLQSASSIDIGFRSRGILMMAVDPSLHGYTSERTAQFLAELRRRVAALPGVASAACTDMAPLSGGHRSDGFSVEGLPAPVEGNPSVDLYMATPGYFQTLGIALVAGRDFANENSTGPQVAVVNEVFVRQLFKNENPLGRRVSGGGATYEIIGVAKNIKSRFLGEEVRPVLFRSLAQSIANDPSFMGYSILVRSAGDPASIAGAVRQEIRSLDPALAIFNAQTMEEHLRDAMFLPRLAGTLFGIFGSVGLLLASVGLYGVMSYSVRRRTHEIGIRMVLGAEAREVRRLVVRQGMLLTLIAMLIGLGVAWAAAKLFTSVLYGVCPHDLVTFTLVPVFLAGVAFLACWIPARRAATVEPMVALRYE
jgi:putative ABC transport system permease protein